MPDNTLEEKEFDDEETKTKVLVSYSAPLPPPAMFVQYNQVVPDAAERILVMAENQSSHRQTIEKIVIIGEMIKSWVGLIFAFVVVVLGIAAGVYLIVKDKEISGLISMFTPLALIAGIFVLKENFSKSED